TRAGPGHGRDAQALPALVLGALRLLRDERADHLPVFRRRHQRRARLARDIDTEVARGPQLADVRVAALGLGAVVHADDRMPVEGEGGAKAVELEPQWRVRPRARELEAILDRGDDVGL